MKKNISILLAGFLCLQFFINLQGFESLFTGVAGWNFFHRLRQEPALIEPELHFPIGNDKWRHEGEIRNKPGYVGK